MKHQIITKTTGDEWEQVMTCEFANATIAELVWQDTTIGYRSHKDCLLADDGPKAELQREGKTITVICKKQEHFARCWNTDPDANRDALETLAKEWQEQEQAWLPTMRYFQIAKEKHNQALLEWSNKHDERLDGLEYQIKSEQLKREGDIKFCEGQITKMLENLLTIEGQIHDILDCLNMDGNQIENLCEAFSLHRELKFHFLDRRQDG